VAFMVWAAAIGIDSAITKFIIRQQNGTLPGHTSFSHVMLAPFLDAFKSGHQSGTKFNCQFWPITAFTSHSV